jgi:hypothetical protein
MSETSTTQRLLGFVRKNGLHAVLPRLKEEVAAPQTPLGRAIYPGLTAARGLIGRLQRSATADVDHLVAFYDLRHWPITFDFLWFMAAADLYRQKAGLKKTHIVLVPSEDWGAGPETSAYFAVVNGEARKQRIYDVLIPAAAMMPTVDGITLASSRGSASQQANTTGNRKFPETYFPETPAQLLPFPKLVNDAVANGMRFETLRSSATNLDWVRSWSASVFGKRPFITITLRNYEFRPLRNSNIDAWVAFAKELTERGFSVVFIPDTMASSNVSEQALGGTIMREACWNLGLRLALYESAYANLGVNNGPMGLCWFSGSARYLTMKMVIEEEFASSIEFQNSLGIDPLQNLPFAQPHQIRKAAADNLPEIRAGFEELCQGMAKLGVS